MYCAQPASAEYFGVLIRPLKQTHTQRQRPAAHTRRGCRFKYAQHTNRATNTAFVGYMWWVLCVPNHTTVRISCCRYFVVFFLLRIFLSLVRLINCVRSPIFSVSASRKCIYLKVCLAHNAANSMQTHIIISLSCGVFFFFCFWFVSNHCLPFIILNLFVWYTEVTSSNVTWLGPLCCVRSQHG